MRRVGGIRDRRIDVRILAATNRDLERDAQRERFRRDLYFRLAVIILHLPPLRERGDDILLLADHYLEAVQRQVREGRPTDRRRGARERCWRVSLAGQRARAEPRDRAGGAVEPRADAGRRASVARHARRRRDRQQGAGAGRYRRTSPPGESASQPAAASGEFPAFPPPGMPLDQWERTLIEQALRECEGNQTRAAQRLGISRDTLRYRLKKHGIQ